MKTISIHLYEFNELTSDAKQYAVSEHTQFLNSFQNTVNEFENITEEDVIESIEINEYLFFASGEIAPCTTYTGKHVKSGTTELNLNGEVFILD